MSAIRILAAPQDIEVEKLLITQARRASFVIRQCDKNRTLTYHKNRRWSDRPLGCRVPHCFRGVQSATYINVYSETRGLGPSLPFLEAQRPTALISSRPVHFCYWQTDRMAAELRTWLRRPQVRDPVDLPDALQLNAPSVFREAHDGRFSCARASSKGTVESLLVVGEPWPLCSNKTPRRCKHVWRDGCMPGLIFGSDSDSAEDAFAEIIGADTTLRCGAWTTFSTLSNHDKTLCLASAEVFVQLDTASLKGLARNFPDVWAHLSDRGKSILSAIWRVGSAEVRDVYYARFNGNGPLASYPAGISYGDSMVALLITWIYHVSRVLPLLWVFTQSVVGVFFLLPPVASLSMAAHRWTVMKDVEHPTLWEQGACVLRDTISILMASPVLAMLRKGDLSTTFLTGVGVLATNSVARRLRSDWVVISKPGRHVRPAVDVDTDTSFRLGVGAVLEGWASRGITGWELGLCSEDVLVLQAYALTQGTCELFSAVSIKRSMDAAPANDAITDDAISDALTMNAVPSNIDATSDAATTDTPPSNVGSDEYGTTSPVVSDPGDGTGSVVSGSTSPPLGGRPGRRRSSVVDGDGSFMGRKVREFRRDMHQDSGRWQQDFHSPERVPQAVRTAPWPTCGLGLERSHSCSSEEHRWDVEEVNHLVQYGTDWKFISDHGVDRIVGCNSLSEVYGSGLERKLVHLERGDRDVVQTVDVNGGSFVTSLATIDLLAARKPPLIATHEELMRISHHNDNGRHLLSLQPARQQKFRFKVKGSLELHPFCRVRKANVLTSVRWFHPIPFAAYILVSSFFPSYFLRWTGLDVLVASVLCVCMETRVSVPAWTLVALSMYQVQREGWHSRSLCVVGLMLLMVEVYIGTLWIGTGKGWWGPLFSLGCCPYLSEAAFCVWHVLITTCTGETLDSVVAPTVG